jgi:hypothetical protein
MEWQYILVPPDRSLMKSGGIRFVDLPGFKYSLVAETASMLTLALVYVFSQETWFRVNNQQLTQPQSFVLAPLLC